MQIRLKSVRIAFPALAEPEAFGDGEPAYQAKFIIEPKSEQAKLLTTTLKKVAEEQWKEKGKDVFALLAEQKKVCYVEGPYRSNKTGEAYAGFENNYYLSARNAKSQPKIIDKHGVEVSSPRDIKNLIYSGCHVHAIVDLWAQDNKWGRRINATLKGVMFAADGESFGGSSVATADDFADLAVSAEDFV
jgi:hypothetical protein